MPHYVCTGGCNMLSEHAGTCHTRDCLKYHSLLTACNCLDKLHEEAYVNPNDKKVEENTHLE